MLKVLSLAIFFMFSYPLLAKNENWKGRYTIFAESTLFTPSYQVTVDLKETLKDSTSGMVINHPEYGKCIGEPGNAENQITGYTVFRDGVSRNRFLGVERSDYVGGGVKCKKKTYIFLMELPLGVKLSSGNAVKVSYEILEINGERVERNTGSLVKH